MFSILSFRFPVNNHSFNPFFSSNSLKYAFVFGRFVQFLFLPKFTETFVLQFCDGYDMMISAD